MRSVWDGGRHSPPSTAELQWCAERLCQSPARCVWPSALSCGDTARHNTRRGRCRDNESTPSSTSARGRGVPTAGRHNSIHVPGSGVLFLVVVELLTCLFAGLCSHCWMWFKLKLGGEAAGLWQARPLVAFQSENISKVKRRTFLYAAYIFRNCGNHKKKDLNRKSFIDI